MPVFSSSPINNHVNQFLSISGRFGLCLPSDLPFTRTAVLLEHWFYLSKQSACVRKLKYYSPRKRSEGDASDMDKKYS